MAAKPETTFIGSVHRHLPTNLYHMKNHNEYISGPADVWYSGSKGDLWVEYKFITLPKRPDTGITPDCSRLQLDWLRDRHTEGRNVAVIVGCGEGGVVYLDRAWENAMNCSTFKSHLLSRKELADWIVDRVGGPP